MANKLAGSVLVTGSSVSEQFLHTLNESGLTVVNPTHLLSDPELERHLASASAYLLGGDEKPSPEILERSKNLKLIAFLGVGYQSFIDASVAGSLGIAVTNTPGTLTQSVAEFSVGQMLNATRKLTYYEGVARKRAAGETVDQEEKQNDLGARKIGIIGLGAIGTRVSEILTVGFGCSVSYFSRTRRHEVENRLKLQHRTLPDLLTSCDLVALFLPRTEETVGMLKASELSSLPASSIIVNISNAEIVDGPALLGALKTGQIATICIDQAYEDASLHRQLLMRSSDQVIYTGHIGSLTHQARDGMAKRAISSIVNFLGTGDDPYVVNRSVLANQRT